MPLYVPSSSNSPLVPVVIFAYNEEDNIIACIERILECAEGHNVKVFVLANGCTDRTPQMVADYAREHDNVHCEHLEYGSKPASWNHYVHNMAVEAPVHLFTDGDNRVMPGSIDALVKALQNAAEAIAATATYDLQSGRNSRAMNEGLKRNGGLIGNLYALKQEYLDIVRARKLYVPDGLPGEDSLLASWAMRNFSREDHWDRNKLLVVEQARVWYPRFNLFSLHDMRVLHKRFIRYALRDYQLIMIRIHAQEQGWETLPRHVNGLYRRYFHRLKMRNRGWMTLYDWIAFQRMRALANTPEPQGIERS